MKRTWTAPAKVVLTAALVLASPGLATAAASADASGGLSHYLDPGTEVIPATAMTCLPGGSPIQGSAAFGTEPGDSWHGTTAYDYCLYPAATNPDRFAYTGKETFTGSVNGCGTGSFTWIAAGAATMGSPAPGGGVWHIVAGSGTGRLRHARGSGTDTAVVTLALQNSGAFYGKFACLPAAGPAAARSAQVVLQEP
jgi:hypothetical protein